MFVLCVKFLFLFFLAKIKKKVNELKNANEELKKQNIELKKQNEELSCVHVIANQRLEKIDQLSKAIIRY